jgi:flagellar assembly protein FliH
MSPATKRFLFDEDFGDNASARRVDVEALKLSADEAFARGVAEGRRLAENEIAARLAGALEQVAVSAGAVLSSFGQERERLEWEVARLTQTFSRKLAGALIERAPLAPLIEAATDCFRHLAGQPHVVVRVPDDVVDQAKAVIDQIALERGLQGKLVILGEPSLAAGDFCIEWADGGILRDGAALERAIAAAVARHCGANANA